MSYKPLEPLQNPKIEPGKEPVELPLAPRSSRPRKMRSPKMRWQEYRAARKASGEPVMPVDCAAERFCKKINLPEGFMQLASYVFHSRYVSSDRVYSDWSEVWCKALKEDWLRLWRCDGGRFQLTTAGQQAALEYRDRLGDELYAEMLATSSGTQQLRSSETRERSYKPEDLGLDL